MVHLPNKTRLAPTPSGYLHLGNAFSFVTTAAIAAQQQAKVLLRIDDLDKDRVRPDYVADIFDTLTFLEIEWQEGPKVFSEYKSHSQFTRLNLYNASLQQLVDCNAVFACDCSRKELQERPCNCFAKQIALTEKDVCWRLKTDVTKTIELRLMNGVTEKHVLPIEQHHFVVRKKDGLPSYQLASLVDDVHYNINLIVRGADLFSSTLAQLYIADVLGAEQFKQARFHHHPILLKNDGSKLSKSAGDTSIQYLRKQGLTKEAIVNILHNNINA
jgi:glutamyl-tRNA synthetase